MDLKKAIFAIERQSWLMRNMLVQFKVIREEAGKRKIDSEKLTRWAARNAVAIETFFEEFDMSEVATIVTAANTALQNQPPAVPVGGAIIDAADVAAINTQAGLVGQPPIPASQIQQAPAAPAAAPPAASGN